LKTSLGKSIKDRPLPLTPPQAEKAKTQHIYVDFNEASQAFYETPTPIASQAIYETPTPITPTRNSIVSTMIEQFNNMQQPTESQPIISTAKRQISQNNDKINPINKPQISH
jgi:hypothetical protein